MILFYGFLVYVALACCVGKFLSNSGDSDE
jgi:hypothetical protein